MISVTGSTLKHLMVGVPDARAACELLLEIANCTLTDAQVAPKRQFTLAGVGSLERAVDIFSAWSASDDVKAMDSVTHTTAFCNRVRDNNGGQPGAISTAGAMGVNQGTETNAQGWRQTLAKMREQQPTPGILADLDTILLDPTHDPLIILQLLATGNTVRHHAIGGNMGGRMLGAHSTTHAHPKRHTQRRGTPTPTPLKRGTHIKCKPGKTGSGPCNQHKTTTQCAQHAPLTAPCTPHAPCAKHETGGVPSPPSQEAKHPKTREIELSCFFPLYHVAPLDGVSLSVMKGPAHHESAHDDRTDVPSHASKKIASSPKALSLGTEADFLLGRNGMLVRSSCTLLIV